MVEDKKPEEKPEEKEAKVDLSSNSKEYKAYTAAAEKAKVIVALIRQGEIMEKKEGKTLGKNKAGKAQRWMTAEEVKTLKDAKEAKNNAYATKKSGFVISFDVRDCIYPDQVIPEDDLRALRKEMKKNIQAEITKLAITAKASGKTEITVGTKKAAKKAERVKIKEQKLKAKLTGKMEAKTEKMVKKAAIKAKIEALKAQAKEI